LLKRFTKELEIYAKLMHAAGATAPRLPSATTTPPSVHTVEALLPYHSQFHSAGLAVTSAEQQSPKTAVVSQNRTSQGQTSNVRTHCGIQVDGVGDGNQEDSSSPTPESSNDTIIQFGRSDALALALTPEVPLSRHQRRKERKEREKILAEAQNDARQAPDQTKPRPKAKALAEVRGSNTESHHNRPSDVNKPLPKELVAKTSQEEGNTAI
jgi:hypothetical protein